MYIFLHKQDCEECAKILIDNKIIDFSDIKTMIAITGIPQYINWEATKINNYKIIYYTDEEINKAILNTFRRLENHGNK